MILQSFSSEETIRIGEKIGSHLQKGDIIALQGFLAAGKTTITKGIALGLGIDEDVTSPTFTLISEYYGRLPLYHFDVYRLDSVEDFLNLGSEEMLTAMVFALSNGAKKSLMFFQNIRSMFASK